MNKSMTYEFAARRFLNQYIKEHNIEEICDLFDKHILIEYIYQMDWDWAIDDAMETQGLSHEEAIKDAEEWFLSMSKYELFYERMSHSSQDELIVDMAEKLGFEWED